MESRRLKHTAYHEAGHAVAYLAQRRRFKEVSVIPTGDHLGHVAGGKWPSRKQGEAAIICCLAGVVAEGLSAGRRYWRLAGNDIHEALDLAEYVLDGGSGPEEISAYVRWLLVRTRAFIGNPMQWVAVEHLAVALLERRRLDYEEAAQIFAGSRTALVSGELRERRDNSGR